MYLKMKPFAIVLLILLPLGLYSQDLQVALNLVNSEQYEEAEKVFEDLLANDAGNGDVYFYYGESVLKDYLADTFSNSLEEFARKAESLFQKGIQMAPSNVLNQVGMGAVTLLTTSDTTKAIPYFAVAEASIPTKKKMFTPQHAIVLTKLAAAQLYGKVNRFKRALHYLNWAKTINEADPQIYLTLGDVFIKQNDASNALLNYNQALNKDPRSPLPKIKIGNIYMRVPNLTAARPYFEEARNIDSTFAPVYRSLGELYSMAGRHDLAKQNYLRFLQLSGNNIPAKIRYGNSLFRSKDYAAALEVIEEVIQVDKSRNYLNRIAAYSAYEKKPQELEKGLNYMEEFFANAKADNIIPRDYAYYGRILMKLAKNDTIMQNKAFDNLKKAYELDPSDHSLLSEMALNYYYSRRYKDAVGIFNLKAEKGIAGRGDPMLLGKCYYSLDDYPNADRVFSEIIEKQPDDLQAHLYLARTYSKMDTANTLGLAKPKFESVIRLAAADSVKNKMEMFESISYMGYFYLQAKDYVNAKNWYNRMYNLDGKNKEWQIRSLSSLAVISYREKDYNEALDVYEQLYALDPANKSFKQTIDDLRKLIAAQKR